MRPEEKTPQVATMKFLEGMPGISVQAPFAFGMTEDSPLGLGSFIIIEFVDGRQLG